MSDQTPPPASPQPEGVHPVGEGLGGTANKGFPSTAGLTGENRPVEYRNVRPDDAGDAADQANDPVVVGHRDLLDRHAAGEVRMLPPTVISLEALTRFDSAAAFLADRPVGARVVPVLVVGDDGEPVLRTDLP